MINLCQRTPLPVSGYSSLLPNRTPLGGIDPLERARRLLWDRTAPGRIRLRTLVLIRWVAVIGQAFTVLLVHYSLGFPLPILTLVLLIALSAALNIPLTFRARATTRLPERTAALLLGFDIAHLALLLALTGGLQNPFTVLILMPVTLSAATLSLSSTIALVILTVHLVTALALVPTPVPWAPDPLYLPALYIFALWCALVLGLILLAGYSWRLTDEARKMSDAMAAMEIALAREQQLSALGGLAAAAAHELGSPLTTIAVIGNEVATSLPKNDPLQEDVAELRAQTRRCRDILRRLSERRHTEGHERFTRAPLTEHLMTLSAEYQRPGVTVDLRIEGSAGEPQMTFTPTLRHSLANLIDNAIDFARSRVILTLTLDPEAIVLRLQDDGPGFAPEIIESLGEPYLSTRHGRGGHGLGIFIASTLLRRTGASLQFDNTQTGAQVTINWSRFQLEEHENAEATTRSVEQAHECS